MIVLIGITITSTMIEIPIYAEEDRCSRRCMDERNNQLMQSMNITLEKILDELKIQNVEQERYQLSQMSIFYDGTPDICLWKDTKLIYDYRGLCSEGKPVYDYPFDVWYQSNWPENVTKHLPYYP